MILTLCISFGLSIILLANSSFFLFKVSRGMPFRKLWYIVHTNPVEDDLLYVTFFNLLWCRLCLILSLISFLVFGGSFLWMTL